MTVNTPTAPLGAHPELPVPAVGLLGWRRAWPAMLLVALAGAMVESGFASLPTLGSRRPLPYLFNFAQILPSWVLLGALVPVTFAWCRQFPPAGPRRGVTIAAHTVGAILFPVVHTVAYVVFMRVAGLTAGNASSLQIVLNLLRLYFGAEVLAYGAIVCLWYAAHFHHEAATRARDAAQLREALVSARLESLRLQLHPHFLFNTLHSIAVMARTQETETLVRTVNNLSELLRAVLDDSTADEVTLSRELLLLERYLEVITVRFRDRLTVLWEIDPACRDAIVPVMILQPLVENALIHGIESRPGPGTVRIQARHELGVVELRITDSGPGFAAAPRIGRGVGLANTRSRLELRWGARCRFEVGGPDGAGGDVLLSFPFERSAATEALEP